MKMQSCWTPLVNALILPVLLKPNGQLKAQVVHALNADQIPNC